MNRKLSEEKVLKQLKIEDFTHLGKDTVIGFASCIQRMDPEVVKKALEQFPNFAVAVKDAIVEYKQVAENIIRSGDKDNDKLIEMIDAEYQQLIKMLDNEELTFEEKLIILERLDDLQNKVSKENKEMRNYRLEVAGGVFAIIGIGILSLAAILGGGFLIAKAKDNDNDIDLDDDPSDIDLDDVPSDIDLDDVPRDIDL